MTQRRPSRQMERPHQIAVAKYLDWAGVLWLHPPNEGVRSPRQGAMLKACGLKPGVPDILILDPPPALQGSPGAAIELKPTRDEAPRARMSREQREWLGQLAQLGWATACARGAQEAIAQLRAWGYGRLFRRSARGPS